MSNIFKTAHADRKVSISLTVKQLADLVLACGAMFSNDGLSESRKMDYLNIGHMISEKLSDFNDKFF